jgi:N-carbamoyl-L-amino-acid hydrolase
VTGFDRTREIVEHVAQCGRTDYGVNRLALTEADRQARKIVISEMESLGMSVRMDSCCSIWGRFEGTSDRPGVVIGSHLDSVPHGGDYDGVLGVASGLGVVRDLLADGARPARSLSVVVFTSEESSRFSLSCIGSRAATGNLTLGETLRFRDSSGKTLLDALREFGGHPEYLTRDCLVPASYHSYFELHIEQGPVLDWNGEDVGIVEAIAAPTRFMLEINGQQAHSGACPMNMRHDALAAAADIILAVERAGREESEFGSVATVGVCQCEPGAMNVVPGRTVLKVDIRGIVEKSIHRVYTQVMNRVHAVEKERGVKIGFTLYSADTPVVMDGLLAHRIEMVCRSRGVKYRRMPSGAGHDAMYMASLIPSALIFVPCKDGISHNPAESIEWERVRPGYEVLRETVRSIVSRN